VQPRAHLAPRPPLLAEPRYLRALGSADLRPTDSLPRFAGLCHAEPSPLANEIALKLGDGREYTEDEAAHRIASWPDVDALRRRDEPDARRVEVADVSEHVERRAPEPVQLPDQHGIDLPAPDRAHELLEPCSVVLAPLPVSSTSSTTRAPRRSATARSSSRARAGFWSSVLTRW
jgi:hypothetical protein